MRKLKLQKEGKYGIKDGAKTFLIEDSNLLALRNNSIILYKIENDKVVYSRNLGNLQPYDILYTCLGENTFSCITGKALNPKKVRLHHFQSSLDTILLDTVVISELMFDKSDRYTNRNQLHIVEETDTTFIASAAHTPTLYRYSIKSGGLLDSTSNPEAFIPKVDPLPVGRERDGAYQISTGSRWAKFYRPVVADGITSKSFKAETKSNGGFDKYILVYENLDIKRTMIVEEKENPVFIHSNLLYIFNGYFDGRPYWEFKTLSL